MTEKEIGKLLELLNEYAPDDFNWCVIDGKIYDKTMDYGDIPVNVEMGVYIISKQFGFIKWLVESDKIDLEEVGIDYGRIHLVGEESGRQHIIWQDLARYEALLMLLSISDTPIEDLISYLK